MVHGALHEDGIELDAAHVAHEHLQRAWKTI
jgi:hypothetical protein